MRKARTSTALLVAACLLTLPSAAVAVQVLYTFEGNSGNTVTDKLTDDGAQDPLVNGSLFVDVNAANAAFGSSSVSFPPSPTTLTTLDIPGTSALGSSFTLAAMVDEMDNDFSRVFSVYNGGGPASNELIFDIDPSLNVYGFGVRAFVHGTGVVRGVNFADANYHHVAMTYDNGTVRLFLDGSQLGADASVPGGDVTLFNNLRFGEDYPPTSGTNEPFEGHADDILVYDRALSATEVQSLAQNGATAFLLGASPHAVLCTFEGDSTTRLTDKLTYDGAQNPDFLGPATVDPDPANAAFGSQSASFPDSPTTRTVLNLPGTRTLGNSFTVAAVVDESQDDWSRLFSVYNGGGPAADEFILDFDPRDPSQWGFNVRAFVNGTGVTRSVPGGFADANYHHVAATYDDGTVRLYVDGQQVGADATVPGGNVSLFADLRFGEDYPPTSGTNEPFEGRADDILVHPGALTGTQIQALAQNGAAAFFTGPQGVLYTFEGDSGTSISDQFRGDGVQNATNVTGSVAVDTNPANAAFGSSSGAFPFLPAGQQNTLDIPGTSSLGEAFTLAAMVDETQNDFSRIFSVYNGGGPAADELILDIDPSLGPYGFGVRGFVHGTGVVRGVNFADSAYHHVAMTYNDGEVRLFLDGTQLGAAATVPGGPVDLFADLRFGEDYPPTSATNERLEGHADDILVYRQPLAPTQMQALAANGAEAFFAGPHGILYTFEGDSGTSATDMITADGQQNPTFSLSTVVDNNPANAAFGSSSAAFGTLRGSTLELTDTSFLGQQFTLAAMVDDVENDFTRLFSNYAGTGPATPDVLLLDFDPGGGVLGPGLRAIVHGVAVTPTVAVRFADDAYHHLAMTYDNGEVRTYLDGILVAKGTAGSGVVNMVSNLFVGEDRNPFISANEQLVGNADDILLLRNAALTQEEMLILANQGAIAAATNPQPVAAGILYTAEGDTANPTDKLLDDGAQDGTFHNAVTIDTNPANARVGDRSIAFAPNSGTTWNTVELADSRTLGEAFTLSAYVDDRDNDFTRLFSNYDGSGPALDGELLLDFDHGRATLGAGLRAIVHGVAVTPTVPVGAPDDQYHHLGMTYDDGVVCLYLDGVLVARGTAGNGPVNLLNNLRLGEDRGGVVNEQLIGNVDDALLLRTRALSPAEMMALAGKGAAGFLADPTPIAGGMLYTGEGDSPGDSPSDKLFEDGTQDGVVINSVAIDTSPANARFGTTSFSFPVSPTTKNMIELPGSARLGDAFTLAAFVDDQDNDFTRLFSAYDGAGAVVAGELIFDFDPSGATLPGLRAIVNGTVITAPVTFADDDYHLLTMTYADGIVRLYLDGEDVGGGTAGSGPVNLLRNLTFGEDPLDPRLNEQLIGHADDILLLRRALSPEEIQLLNEAGAAQFAPPSDIIPEPATSLLLSAGLGLLGLRRRRHPRR